MGANKSKIVPGQVLVPPLPNAPSTSDVQYRDVPLTVKQKFTKTTCDTSIVTQVIGSAELAGAGYVLKASYLPIYKTGDYAGRPTETSGAGLTKFDTVSHLSFIQTGSGPIETTIFKTNIEIRAGWTGNNVFTDNLQEALKQATVSGYSVACIVENPGTKFGWTKETVQIELVCQRPVGQVQSTQPKYTIVAVPVVMKMHLARTSADLSALATTLAEWGQKGFRLATIYDPLCGKAKGFSKIETAILLIMEQTNQPWVFSVHNAQVLFKPKFTKCLLDSTDYKHIINAYSQGGWMLAAMYDNPECRNKGLGAIVNTATLIFQAPASWAQGGATGMSAPPSYSVATGATGQAAEEAAMRSQFQKEQDAYTKK